jgi:hypothetical protein
MLLTKPYIIDINMTKRCRDPFILSYNEFNYLFIIAEDRLKLTEL